uniref:CARD domain-containing protein n=1 Tax=Myripristis murdjan TaxID=586833 RepID=A0A667X042_9TELE
MPADERLRAVRTKFIDRVSEPNLDSLLLQLGDLKVINSREEEAVKDITLRPDKATKLIDMVINKGPDASSHMITILCELDEFLSAHLKLHNRR